MGGIPFATTLISVERNPVAELQDGYDPINDLSILVSEGVRAVISTASVNTSLNGGFQVLYNASMHCDPCDISQDDVVTDSNGTQWRVLNVIPQGAFGLRFMIAQLRYVEGSAV